MTKSSELNERSQQLLKTLVERYIHDGQPVGSRVLSKDSDLKLSPATIRNVMADLEDLGLIHSPHTSAGRVPTVNGYRFFVDTLLTVKPLHEQELDRLHQGLDKRKNDDLLGMASKLLSETTQMAGVVTLPRKELVCLRHIEFLPLSNTRVLVIFVTNEHEVHNRVIHTSKKFSATELQQAANYLTSMYAGKSLASVRAEVLKEMQEDQQRMNQSMLDAVSMAQLAFNKDENKEEDYVLSGQTNLMDFAELSDMDRLKSLFDAFSQKRGIIHLLDKCLAADGVQIYIGEESGYRAFDHCSLVTSSYTVNDEVVGVLGVIGPTRMAYERIIPFVDVTAKLLGAALNTK
ncbi:heat-inducible transcriptional repressor HrcA [methanotrophic endosymbiont of Bathymodiolus puteoserpentis (Logatchev)]|uniref:heat-inducible transcriptional repressor HrcA n=1 Tax=methanotrophic endosymbiont of Bathymodiolus puteoserpentis (Logatchev) TaxID=343235 RepID=UPI0013C627B8|nr:heat-inducible transcriptional repressor HrcA [methanotrophic endosymbiont of Bathymodiolus puteoserpentis (Logatchev)]SHE22146.1 Heat-inducible transcription repressor HrcA [methanotrophic endosymbiont of Bathymodiolus puteoserpentis (Logatchev)]